MPKTALATINQSEKCGRYWNVKTGPLTGSVPQAKALVAARKRGPDVRVISLPWLTQSWFIVAHFLFSKQTNWKRERAVCRRKTFEADADTTVKKGIVCQTLSRAVRFSLSLSLLSLPLSLSLGWGLGLEVGVGWLLTGENYFQGLVFGWAVYPHRVKSTVGEVGTGAVAAFEVLRFHAEEVAAANSQLVLRVIRDNWRLHLSRRPFNPSSEESEKMCKTVAFERVLEH